MQEVIAAVHGSMRVLGLSTITNVHNPENPIPATVEEIIAVAQGAAPLLEKIMKGVAEKIYESGRSVVYRAKQSAGERSVILKTLKAIVT